MASKPDAALIEPSAPNSLPPSMTAGVAIEAGQQGVPREIDVDLILVTNNNQRTEFDTEDDANLLESIRRNGIVSRLWVRDNSKWTANRKGKDSALPTDYDLIAGERRLRVAKKLGLTKVPCEVFDVDDEKAYELMTIENLQRKDLHELDYAAGFQTMQKRFGYTVEKIMAVVDKKETFVRELLHLNDDLPEKARQAFRANLISKSHAVLIATIPGEKEREQFARRVLIGQGFEQYRASGEPLSVAKAKELKEREFMKDLKGAPFPLDLQLDPSWPHSCLTCPHYNGNTPETRQGKRPNICLNPPHYLVMVTLNAKRLLDEAENEGKKVVTDTRTIFRVDGDGKPHMLHNSPYVDVCDTFMDSGDGYRSKPWGPVVKAAGLETVVAIDPAGRPRKLVLKSEAEAAARAQGYNKQHSSSSSSRSTSKQQAAVRAKQRIRRETAARAVASTETIKKFWGSLKLNRPQQNALRNLVLIAIKDADCDGRKFLAQALGLELSKRQFGGPVGEPTLKKHASTLKGADLFAFLVQASVAKGMHNWAVYNYGEAGVTDRLLLGQCGVNTRSIMRTVTAEKRAKKKKPAKAKARRAGKPKVPTRPKAVAKAA